MTTKTLAVRNLVQKALFLAEFQGQISDGAWENSGPRDHYQDWMLKANEVIVCTATQGRNFYARKDNYNLNSTELREIIGDRMLFIARFATWFPYETSTLLLNGWLPDSLKEIADAFETKATSGWMKDRGDLLKMLGTTYEKYERAFATAGPSAYSEMDLRKDIADLRKAMKNFETGLESLATEEHFIEVKGADPEEAAEFVEGIKAAITTEEPKPFNSIFFGSHSYKIRFEGNGWYQLDSEFNTFWKIEMIQHDCEEPIVYVKAEQIL